MMKQILIIFLTIGCAVILFLGNQQWKEKVQVQSHGALVQSKTVEGENRHQEETDHLLSFAANWPAEAQANFKKALESGQPYKMVIAGSPALGQQPSGWSAIVQQELKKVYGESVDVSVKSYDLTSVDFINEGKHEELAAERGDMVLLEPFILKNNGIVGNELAAGHYSEIIQAIKDANEKAVVILQPANPLSKARFYPLQVEALKEYAQANNLPYIDHWQAWPETEEERLALLDGSEQSYPNEAGHKLWAEHLVNYFISH